MTAHLPPAESGRGAEYWSAVYAAAPPARAGVVVDGVDVAASVWPGVGTADAGRDVVLIHGGAAHRQWWDHLAPLIRGAATVVAVDLSGHGDSGRRDAYGLDAWADEVDAVAQSLCARQPVLVGASMGGLVAVHAAQRAPGSYRSVLVLDSPLRRGDGPHARRRDRLASRPVPSYGSPEEALARYRTFPPTDGPPAVMRHVARTAYRRDGQKWTLKYDPLIYRRPQVSDDLLEPAKIPTVWVRAEHGFVDADTARIIPAKLGPLGALTEVPGAGHHLLLEQPLATAWLIGLHLQQPGA